MSGTTNPDYAQVAAMIGLTTLRGLHPTLDGAGVTVGQVEASASGNSNDFEVDPGQIGHPADNSDGFLTYHNGLASSGTFNDGIVGTYSPHATTQASFFYGDAMFDGAPTGVAPDVAHVDSYFADNFTTNLTVSFPDKVVNMSFLYDSAANFDSDFDAAANAKNVVFVASAGNDAATPPGSPGSAYNVICVDSSITIDSIGPGADGARKPDISAPQLQTSRTAAIVSGAATLLVQAGDDGWTGATAQNKQDAVDFRTVKALLLNGATKPADYDTNAYAPTASQPLSAIYGSGQVNILNAVNELYGGEVAPGASNAVVSGGTLATPLGLTPVATTQGWDLGTLAATAGHDEIDSYEFNLTAGHGLIATITWAADNSNAIDTLELDLVNNSTGAVLATSDAPDSNVQQIRYQAAATTSVVLEVRLHGVSGGALQDKYALAFAPLSSVACYCAGTRILTTRGEVPIEALAIGDRVVTLSGASKPIQWIGRRRYRLDHHAENFAMRPVLIRRGAIADDLPRRDLCVSPEHAFWFDGTLMPARLLTNNRTILRRDDLTVIEYIHLELAEHDVIFAEGVPAETYLDSGNRAMFDNAADCADTRHARRACAPRVEEGPLLADTQQRLRARAGFSPPDWRTGASGPLIGNFERVAADYLEGWAQDASAPECPVRLEILTDGAVIASVLANRHRDDLLAAGLGSGRHAFRLPMRPPASRIDVRRAADGAALPGSPIWCR